MYILQIYSFVAQYHLKRVPKELFQNFKQFLDSLCQVLMVVQILVCIEVQWLHLN